MTTLEELKNNRFIHGLGLDTPTLSVTVSQLREFNESTLSVALHELFNIPVHSVRKMPNGEWLVNLLSKSLFLSGERYSWLVDVCKAGKEGINLERDDMIFTFKIFSNSQKILSDWSTTSSTQS